MKNYMLTDLEAIQTRISRRNYISKKIEKDLVDHFINRIIDFNHDSGLTISFIENASKAFDGLSKSYGMFKGVRSLIVLKGPSSDIHLKEKCGYFGELLVLEATKLGLGTCWVAGTFDKKDPLFNCQDGEQLVCVIPIGYNEVKNSFGEKVIRKLSHRRSKDLEEFYSVLEPETKIPTWFIEGIKAVMLAPSAMNSQPVYFEVSGDKIAACTADRKGTDLVDLGIAKLHFELAARGSFPLGNGANFHKDHNENNFSNAL
ncbi:nitroreductase family protein [Fusibacter bizertensis]|uniref:Nitroreductase family protein n=1 Tax=Fusibacter bizertensis TaxID=1488331 RepID=A0ABT6NCW3_9FIRM|nr:nitroreductase family protein [Fusibacter bizertensis]MDH8678254.1 nitroreductase family protein [Fusibacter bizertensis]